MPVPFLMATAAASGFTAAVGSAIAGAIGLSGLSAATTFAIGSGVISGGLALASGKKFDDALKAAVVGGVTSFIGAEVAKNITTDVFNQLVPSLANGTISSTTISVVSEAVGQGAAGAIQGGLTAIAYKEDPIDALLKGGLTAGLAAGTQTFIDRKFHANATAFNNAPTCCS